MRWACGRPDDRDSHWPFYVTRREVHDYTRARPDKLKQARKIDAAGHYLLGFSYTTNVMFVEVTKDRAEWWCERVEAPGTEEQVVLVGNVKYALFEVEDYFYRPVENLDSRLMILKWIPFRVFDEPITMRKEDGRK